MKLSIITTAFLPLALLSAAPSPTLASPEPDSALARSHHLALVRRERALLRPAMRPDPALMPRTNTKVTSAAARNSKPLPLRRQNTNAITGGTPKRRDGKMATRRTVAEFGPEGALAMRGLPLPMQVRAATAQEVANNAAGVTSTDDEDPDVEDDWDCEEEESAETDSYVTSSYPATPYTPSAPSSSSTYSTPDLTSTVVTSATSSSAPRPTPTATYLRPASHVEKVIIPTSLAAEASSSLAVPSSTSSSTTDASAVAPSSADVSPSSSTTTDDSTDTIITVVTQTDEAVVTKTGPSTNPKVVKTTNKSASSSSATSQAAVSVGQASSFGLVDPVNLAEGSLTVAEGCTRFHTVLSGEVCLGIIDYSSDIGLTLEQLYAYNPAINDVCTNLSIGWGLCIGKSATLATAQAKEIVAAPVTTSSPTTPEPKISTTTSTLPPTTDVTTTTIVVDVTSTSTLPYVAPTVA